MLIEEEEEGEKREGETEVLVKELLDCGDNRLEKLSKFVSSSGHLNLIEMYESNEIKGVDLIASFLAWVQIYASGEGCSLGLKVAIEMLNKIEAKHANLYNMVSWSLIHCINSLLSDLDDQLKREELNNDIVRELESLKTCPNFLKIPHKTFEFNFDSLMKFSLTLDPYDMPLSETFMNLLHFFFLLPKNQETNDAFLDLMLANVGFIHNMCPYILHQRYQWIIGLGFHFRKTFVYSKIGGVDQFRKKLLVIVREDLLGDSLREIESVDDLMFGVDIHFLGEEGRGVGLIRDWLCSVMTDMVQVVDGDELNGRYARPFAQTQADQTRVFPQPGFMLQDSNLPGGFFRCFGRVVGLAIKHNIQLGFTFDAVLFHQLAGQPVDLEDIRDSSPDKYRWYNRIIDVNDSELIKQEDLFFAVKFGSDVKDIEKGDKGVVTLEHKAEFVRHSLYLEFVDSIRDAVVEIGDGLDDVISYSSRKLFFKAFTLEDCDLLLRGLSKLNLDEWKSYTEYNDYTPADPVVSWFWECVGEFSEEQRIELFNFWTATRWLPPGGFKELNPRPLIQLAYPTAEEDVDKRYPVAHTCIRSLAFPRYTSIEVMREMLRMAVYSSHTFGLV